EALVGLLGRAEAGVLPHGPDAAPIHVGVNPTGVGIRAGLAYRPVLVGAVDRGDRDTAVGQMLALIGHLTRSLRPAPRNRPGPGPSRRCRRRSRARPGPRRRPGP